MVDDPNEFASNESAHTYTRNSATMSTFLVRENLSQAEKGQGKIDSSLIFFVLLLA